MFASCAEKITNHKFFGNQVATQNRQPSCNQQELFLRAININQGFFLQKLEQFVFFVLFFSATPHTTMIFFAVHTNFLWQPDSIILCKQAQQNNCRLAHTADYYLFYFAMHMVIMLQPDSVIRCKQAQHNN
jgi:hypothetical protein